MMANTFRPKIAHVHYKSLYEELCWETHSDRRKDTRITKVCMKNYDGKHFQTVDRIRALQQYV